MFCLNVFQNRCHPSQKACHLQQEVCHLLQETDQMLQMGDQMLQIKEQMLQESPDPRNEIDRKGQNTWLSIPRIIGYNPFCLDIGSGAVYCILSLLSRKFAEVASQIFFSPQKKVHPKREVKGTNLCV
eukprot:GHVP01001678.1.p1 GENE.GHVP01001678.1~~GHVP01001678.1.p1  ORF type:complete len:128 (+),score=12.20 GHVP01001678.1:317-700(+)